MIDRKDRDEDNKPMKFLLLLFFLHGCASFHTKGPETSEAQKPRAGGPDKAKEAISRNGGVWELLTGKQLTLQFKEVDSGNNLTIIIDEGISERPVPAGHWELTGFEENGHSFVSMNTSKKFIFTMKGKSSVYAGSIVIGCPRLQSSQFKLLKKMKFFNRYPFSSSQGLCELVIGNDLSGVRTAGKFKKLGTGF